jgi:hypothetical protein
MSFDLGLLKQGDPVVTLRGNGTLLGDPAFEQDIRAEEAELAASTDDFDVIPFVAVGLLFRF